MSLVSGIMAHKIGCGRTSSKRGNSLEGNLIDFLEKKNCVHLTMKEVIPGTCQDGGISEGESLETYSVLIL